MAAGRRRLAVLDVGHGNSAVLEDEEGVVVIDSGPGSALLEYLQGEGIGRIDLVLISHADADHISGLVALLSCGEFSIGRVRLNSDSEKQSKVWEDLLFELDEGNRRGGIDFYTSLAEVELERGELRIEVIGPSKYLSAKGPGGFDRVRRKITGNSMSAVIRLLAKGRAVALFAGDVDEIGLDELERTGRDVRSPILVFPHHGGKVGKGDGVDFAQKICAMCSPQIVIFSIGRGRYDTPRPEIVSTVQACIPNVRVVCTQLSDHCAAELPPFGPRHLVDVFSQGRSRRKCCSGTIMVGLDDEPILPLVDGHQSFITQFAPTALCRRGPDA